MEDGGPCVPIPEDDRTVNRNGDEDVKAATATAATTIRGEYECSKDEVEGVSLIRLDEDNAELFNDVVCGGEGYTPLNDINMSCGGIGIHMAMEGEDYQTGGAADPDFIYTEYAPMTMASTDYNDDDDDDDDDDYSGQGNGFFFSNPLASSPIPQIQDELIHNDNNNNNNNDGNNGQRSDADALIALADQVLRSLDDEYRCSAVGVPPTIHNTDIHKHSDHNHHNNHHNDQLQQSSPTPHLPHTKTDSDTQQLNLTQDATNTLNTPKILVQNQNSTDTNASTNAFPTSFLEQTITPDAASTSTSTSTSNPYNVTSAVSSSNTQKKDTPIDKQAIAKAVNSIRLRSPDLTATLDSWKAPPQHASLFQKTKTKKKLRHALVPTTPLRAFQRSTLKARAATSNLTRSATIAEAFVRLFLSGTCNVSSTFVIHVVGADHVECDSVSTVCKTFLPFVRWLDAYVRDRRRNKQTGTTTATATTNAGSTSVAQGDNEDHLQNTMTSTEEDDYISIEHVRIELLGPNVPAHAPTNQTIDLLTHINTTDLQTDADKHGTQKSTGADADAATPGGLLSCTAVCKNCLYHDYLEQIHRDNDDTASPLSPSSSSSAVENKATGSPNMAIAFNAGIWGYDLWKPTLKALCFFHRPIPFVITAYTTQEAEDDTEVVKEVIDEADNCRSRSPPCLGDDSTCKENDRAEGDGGSGSRTSVAVVDSSRCLWEVEVNRFGSRKERETHTAPKGRLYFENGAWQAWLLGGGENLQRWS